MANIVIKQCDGTATNPTYQELTPKASSSSTLVSHQVSNYFNLNNASINDVLEWIGRYNLYWWISKNPEKYGYIEKQTDMLGQSGQAYYIWYYNNSPYTIQYSKEVEINQNTGKIQLKNPIEFTATKYDSFYGEESNQVLQEFANLLPCYVTNLYKSSYTTQRGDLSTDIIYLPSNSTWAFGGEHGSYQKTFTGSNNGYASKYTFYIYDVSTTTIPAKRISSEFKKISEAGEISYVYSENQNTYPQERFEGDVYYSYLGQPFQKFPGITSIVYGTYTGTGSYGADSSNSLVFVGIPKLVLIQQDNVFYSDGSGSLLWTGWETGINIVCKARSNKFTWYSTKSASSQRNSSGEIYHYLILG